MVGLEKIDWRKPIEERNTFVLQLQNWYQQLGIKYSGVEYRKEFLVGYIMLYSFTNNSAIDKQIVADGIEMGVLANIHD